MSRVIKVINTTTKIIDATKKKTNKRKRNLLEEMFPELGEPGIPSVVVDREAEEVVVEALYLPRLRLDGQRALHLRLVVLEDHSAGAPAVAADPREVARGIVAPHRAHHAGHFLVRAEHDDACAA